MNTNIKADIVLSDYTTIGLGGKAKYFLSCRTTDDICGALEFAKENKLTVQVLSGGSNIIFQDSGYDGLVLKIDLKGIEINEEENYVYIKVKSGENWDEFVRMTIDKSLSGAECMTGIPGSVGATPIQNVGAYGQEVKEIIHSVTAIDRNTLDTITYNNSDCRFDYRTSRFKTDDKDKHIITEVTFRFQKNKEPEIKYPELQKNIQSNIDLNSGLNLKDKLTEIRKAVISLRKKKSMITDKSDPNSKSCGSFFMNPVLTSKEFAEFKSIVEPVFKDFPFFKTGNDYKIPAAWLVEQSGFYKGYIKEGAGISENHSLAIINRNGSAKDVLSLASDIEKKVFEKFGLKFAKEPVVVSNEQ